MSGQGTIKLVDDDEMSSQGSVNAPVAASSAGTQVQSPVMQQTIPPTGSPLWPQLPIAQVAPTVQSSVFAHPSAFATTVPVAGGSEQTGSVAPTIPLDVPTRQETKKAFEEASSAFQDMLAQHRQIKGGLQASTVEVLRQAK